MARPVRFWTKGIASLCFLHSVLCIVHCALCIDIYAQKPSDANLVGHVIDAMTGEHLPFVTIQLANTQ